MACTDPGRIRSTLAGMDARYDSALTRSAIVLDEVERALGRLDEGTYGTCETCGTAILAADLSFDPTRRHCAEHKPAGWSAGAAPPPPAPRSTGPERSVGGAPDAAPAVGTAVGDALDAAPERPGTDTSAVARALPGADLGDRSSPYDQYDEGA